MRDARVLAWVLVDPSRCAGLTGKQWTSLLTIAHAEKLLGTLAARIGDRPVPQSAASVLQRAHFATKNERQVALWEAEMAKRALAPLGIAPILLKGGALAAADLDAGIGRSIGDLDIMVPRERLDETEATLLAAGWEWAKPDAYDDHYYRTWMHELPPMIHTERDRMIDVHHTILPLTARVMPDAKALIAGAVGQSSGYLTLCPEDMVLHSVAHLFADGELAGGMRNLWDIDQLLRQFAQKEGFWQRLCERAALHSLTPYLARALRLSHHLYETPVDERMAKEGRLGDIYYAARILARNGWGQENQKLLVFAFYIRSHWIRMPPLLLARHLWTKWRKGAAKDASQL